MHELYAFLSQFSMMQIIAYFGVINLLAFLAFRLDKRFAEEQGQRIPENTLFLLSLAGGSPAAIAAMQIFRHKTRKSSFKFVMGLIVAVQLAALIGFVLFLPFAP